MKLSLGLSLGLAATLAAGAVASPAGEGGPLAVWTGGRFPTLGQLPQAQGVEFRTIKPYEPERDGYKWLHGVALCWHEGRLYASYGTNPARENSAGERCHCRVSADGGKTWSAPQLIDDGDPAAKLAVSHGALLSHGGRLHSFMGAFTDDMRDVRTRLAVLEPETGRWRRVGTVVGGGFWPMQAPVRMGDGNWIMGGLRCAKGLEGVRENRPAVAVSDGDDLTKWTLIVVEEGPISRCWGEATVDVSGPFVTLTSRPGWKAAPAVALVATSADYGRRWTPLRPTNLPMATAKPFTGRLSDGRRYAVNSMTADGGAARDSMVIALSRPGEWAYSTAWLVRTAGMAADGKPRKFCYPYAVERDGKLYLGYSDSGGRGGNFNSAELAVIPLASLSAAPGR